jgi:hypothetical protein
MFQRLLAATIVFVASCSSETDTTWVDYPDEPVQDAGNDVLEPEPAHASDAKDAGHD